MSLKAVLFDMDGTLVDSIPSWHMTFNMALESQGYQTVAFEEFKKSILGQSTEQDISRFFPKMSSQDLLKLYSLFFPENLGHIRLFPKTLSILEMLKKKGIKKAIVTNTPRNLMDMTLKHLGIGERFDILVCATDVENGKPDPQMLNLALDSMSLSCDEALLVGDTFFDMDAAQNCGVRSVGIGVPGDMMIDSISELPKVIESLC